MINYSFFAFLKKKSGWDRKQIMPAAFILGWLYALSSIEGYISGLTALNKSLYAKKGINLS